MADRKGTRIVVTGEEHGSVFPQNREELLKDITVDGTKEPFHIQGGVYSKNLLIQGAGTVHSQVFAGENLRLEKGGDTGKQHFLSGISAGKTIVSTDLTETDLENGPAARTEGIRFVIRGDVNAGERVVLKNALVIGSINAPSVQIEGCIVLVSVFAVKSPGHFHSICSTFGLYRAKKLTLAGPTTLMVAGGSSEQTPDLVDHVTALQKTYPVGMRLYSLCMIPEAGCGEPAGRPEKIDPPAEGRKEPEGFPGISCPYWLSGLCGYRDRIGLYASDFIEMLIDNDNRVSGSENIQKSKDEGKKTAWFLGTQSRALHLEKVRTQEEEFQKAIDYVFAFEHVRPEVRARLREEIQKNKKLSSSVTQILSMAIEKLGDV